MKYTDNLLTVIRVNPASEKQLNDKKVSKAISKSGKFVGVIVDDVIVVQSLLLDASKIGDEIVIGDKSKEYKLLITDLNEGTWSINGKTFSASSQGTVYTTMRGGKLIFNK